MEYKFNVYLCVCAITYGNSGKRLHSKNMYVFLFKSM